MVPLISQFWFSCSFLKRFMHLESSTMCFTKDLKSLWFITYTMLQWSRFYTLCWLEYCLSRITSTKMTQIGHHGYTSVRYCLVSQKLGIWDWELLENKMYTTHCSFWPCFLPKFLVNAPISKWEDFLEQNMKNCGLEKDLQNILPSRTKKRSIKRWLKRKKKSQNMINLKRRRERKNKKDFLKLLAKILTNSCPLWSSGSQEFLWCFKRTCTTML